MKMTEWKRCLLPILAVCVVLSLVSCVRGTEEDATTASLESEGTPATEESVVQPTGDGGDDIEETEDDAPWTPFY